MSRVWTCRKCCVTHSRLTQKCVCGQKRPAPRRPKHTAALDLPYEAWVELFGERCGICGRTPAARALATSTKVRRLDRDHDHATGEPRGLLCWLCNKALTTRMDEDWLRAALAYVERTNVSGTRNETGSARV